MQRNLKIALAAVLVLAIAGGTTWWGLRRSKPAVAVQPARFAEPGTPELTLAATKSDATGVDVASGFELTSLRSLSAEAVRQHVSVQPAVELKVEGSGQRFHLVPQAPLEPNRIYRIGIAGVSDLTRPYQWSFQTRATFRILGSLPRNQGAGVPKNTGIEITFSHHDYEDIEPYFKITPAVPGRFERHGKTAVFVPTEQLKAGTIYTVTLSQGLKQKDAAGRLTEDYTFRFETQAAQDNSKPQSYFFVPVDAAEYATDEAPYLQVYTAKLPDQQVSVGVKVYRYPDAAAYVKALQAGEAVPYWANWSREQYREKPDGLPAVASFDARPAQPAGANSPYIFFPQPLPAGYYLAELSAAGITRQVHLQVTDVSEYTVVSETKTLVWVNDLKTRAPLAGASVQPVGGGSTVQADAGGVAVLPTPAVGSGSDTPRSLYVIVHAPDGREAVTGGAAQRYSYRRYGPIGNSSDKAVQYWKYVYLDRPLYRADDTVKIFGVARPREPGAQPLASVMAEVVRWDYSGPDSRQLSLASATLPVSDGTYTGDLPLPGLKPGYYTLQVKSGEDVLSTTSFEVQSYTKPAYRLEVKPSKNVIMAGDKLDFTITTRFFEGTPAPGVSVNWSLRWGNEHGGTVTTDSAGTAVIPFAPTAGEAPSQSGPQYSFFNASVRSPETGDLFTGAHLQIFGRNVLSEERVTVDAGQATLSVQVNQVDLSKAEQGYKGAPAAGQAVQGTLIEQTWVAEPAGEVYDFINKVTNKTYNYREQQTKVGSFSEQTGPSGVATHSFSINPERFYRIKLRVQDTAGQWLDRETWFSGKQLPQMAQRPQAYTWYQVAPEQATNKNRFALGEAVPLSLQSNQVTLANRPQGFLFYTARLGLRGFKVQDSARFPLALQQADLPTLTAAGVYFDGRSYHAANEYTLRFDPAERKLQVQVTPDKASYRPGDTVNLSVAVTDPLGKPAQAQVNLNLVDEALFALQDQRVDTLESIYQEWVPSGILVVRASHAVPAAASGAEKGGDGGSIRKEFKDAIFFRTVSTDAAGKATASFQVPDNLTSWRVTYQALVPTAMQAGSGTVQIPVKLPFFTDLVLGSTYLTGDKPVATLRAFGSALDSGQAVDFTVDVTGPDGNAATATAHGSAFAPVTVPLSTLKAGTYKVTVKASAAGGLSDAMEQSISVVDSYLQQTKIDYLPLSPETKVQGGEKGLTLLTFTDHNRSRYLRLLQGLRWQWGDRLDQRLTRAMAGDLLQQYLDDKQLGSGADVATFSYQAPDGGVAILPYADSDLDLSVLAADLAPKRFDHTALATYLQKIVDDATQTRDRQALALYGLASLDLPVLTDVRNLLGATDLQPLERLHLGLALAALGDLEGARPVYYGLLKDKGEDLAANARLKVSENQDEILVATARMGVLAAKLGEFQAPMFAGYLLATPAKDVLLSMEETLLAQTALAKLPGESVSFTYVLRGAETAKSLKAGESFRLAVTPADLAALKFKAVTGQVGLTVSYTAPLNPASVKTGQGFVVSRTLTAADGSKTLHPGDLVQVTLNYTLPDSAPGGSYEVTDYLPSGLRAVPRFENIGAQRDKNAVAAWPIAIDGQMISFRAYKDGKPLTYYARVASPGDYTAEQTVLMHSASGIVYALGTREQVQLH